MILQTSVIKRSAKFAVSKQDVCESCFTENTFASHGCYENITWLQCAANNVIRIKDVMYGRLNNTVCSSMPNETTAQCKSQTALQTLSPLCNGKHSCVLIPSTSLFGDPCPNVTKYVDVDYTCLGKHSCRINSYVILPSQYAYVKLSVFTNCSYVT